MRVPHERSMWQLTEKGEAWDASSAAEGAANGLHPDRARISLRQMGESPLVS